MPLHGEERTSDALQSSGRGDLALIGRPSNSDSKPVDPRLRPREVEAALQSNPNLNGNHVNPDGGDDERQGEIVWLHGRLCGYKVANGKPFVLVPWYPTWEPPDE